MEYRFCTAVTGQTAWARRSVCLRDPPVGGLSGLHQLFHGAGCLLDGHAAVDPVDIAEIQMVCLEALQGAVDGCLDGLRPAIRDQRLVHRIGCLVKTDAALGSQHDLAAIRFQCLS